MARFGRGAVGLGLALMLAGPWAVAAPRVIATGDGFTATVSDRNGWCADTVFVTVKTADPQAFAGDQAALRAHLARQVVPALARECPAAAVLRLSGVVESRGTVFMGSASRSTDWTLTSGRAPVQAAAPAPLPAMPAMPATPVAKVDLSTLGPIALCDVLGAHPHDPEATAQGVPDEQLQAGELIRACSVAVQRDPWAPRLNFQLARAHLKAGRDDEALEQLVAAAKLGHGGALAYLADLHLEGGSGIEADPPAAHALYTQALAAGFEPAREILAQFEDFTDRSAQADQEEKAQLAQPAGMDYVNPDIIENVLRGDLDEVPFNEYWVKNYLVEVADGVGQECKAHFTPADVDLLRKTTQIRSVDTTAAGGIANIFNGLEMMAEQMAVLRRGGSMGEVYQNAAEQDAANQKAEMQVLEEGIKDSFIFLMKHPCGTPQVATFARHLRAYVEDAGAPRLSTEHLFQSCLARNGTKVTSPENKNFCFCVARKLTSGVSMTRAERKALASNFKAGAQRVIDKNQDQFRSCF